MKALNLDDVTLTSQIMTSYRKIKITSEKIVNYRVTSPSNHCCQISFIVRERPGISAMMHFFLFLRCHSKIFKLLKPVYSQACMLTALYQFDKKLMKHFPANIYLFKVRIVILRQGARLMKKTYNSLKKSQQDDGQLFLVHFQGEQHSGIARYTQNWRFPARIPLMRSVRLWDPISLQGSP